MRYKLVFGFPASSVLLFCGTRVRDVNLNLDFGKLKSSFTQEGVNNRCTVRLRLRITF